MRKAFCVIFFYALVTGLFAQRADDWYYDKPIRKIEFVGLQNVKAADVEAVTKQFIGNTFSDDIYADVLSRIYALEFFEDVIPEVIPANTAESAIILRFTVIERPIVTKITFTGNRQVRTTELRSAVSLKEKDVYIPAKTLLDERAIRDVYLKQGYTDITVSSRVEDGKNGFELTFLVNEGASTVVTAINFQGNFVFTERTLRGQLSTKAVGFLRKGSFQEAQLEQDRQAVLTYYQDRGYIDATILDISRTTTFNTEKNQNELVITFVLQEGFQYIYDGITLSGNVIFSDEQLLERVSVKPGEVYNQTKFQASIMAIADLYYENGYTNNGFLPEAKKDSESHHISYAFTIDERPRSHIENIILRGNDKTKDYVILREIPLESGDIFSKAKITNGLRNLYNLQFFSAIVPDIVPGSEEDLVDLVINIEEQSTTAIEFGLTFSGIADPTKFPLSLFLKYTDTNLVGTGKTISVDTTLTFDQQSVSLGYGDSWVFGIPLDISASFGFSHKYLTTIQNLYTPAGVNSPSSYMNYRQLDFSIGAGVGHRWSFGFADLRVGGGLTASLLRNYYDANLYEPFDSTIASYEGGWRPKTSVYASVSLDHRDLNYDPGKGWFSSERLTWTGLLPVVENEFYLRTDTKAEIYFTLLDLPLFDGKWSLKFVLAGMTSLSFLLPANDMIGETSKLYIDGMFNGRGWSSATERGEAMWSSTVELRWPLISGLLAADFFFDAVALTEKPGDFFTNMKADNWRFSFGPGIRFSMPQFPLRLLFTWGFSYVDGKFAWKNDPNAMEFVLSFNIVNR
jgi:outer membrane protein insertion porin family